jgi:hypothetical protein
MPRLPFLAFLLSFPFLLQAANVDFVRDVRPILQKHCYDCHGPDKQKAGLRLDAKSAALKGGDNHSPNIIPGKAADSPLIKFIRGEDEEMKMPPKGKQLSTGDIATLTAWINEGAVWPDGVDLVKVENRLDHWAFQPLKTVPGQAIDTFIKAKLAGNGLTMSAEADRRILIRRLYFVLHGLPPTPEQVAAFIADSDPLAYNKLVDRLLDSPRYGERWARHWLDVIPFGETHGFEVNTPRDNAWPYRDYVIQAFNKDTPYPRFILEQLAGDTLGVDAATGFIVAAAALLPGQIGKDQDSKDKARQDELNEMIAGAGGAFLGLTLHCARCHDHKFDPVTQKDYYSLQAIFAGVRHGERMIVTPGWEEQKKQAATVAAQLASATGRLLDFEPIASLSATPTARRLPVHSRQNVDRFAPTLTKRIRFTALATSENNRYAPCLDELEIYTAGADRRNVAKATAGAKLSCSSETGAPRHQLVKVNDGLYGNSHSWISKELGKGWVEVEFAQPETVEAVVWGRDRQEEYRDRLTLQYRIEAATADGAWQTVATSADRDPWLGEKGKFTAMPPGLDGARLSAWHALNGEADEVRKKLRNVTEPPMVYAGRFEKPEPTYKLYRGEASQRREQVTPGTIEALGTAVKLPADAPERERRLALARWLGDPKNPLPARVLVNRLWQHHFGEGIVGTPNDFGRNGARPTHPELLDWLASEFIRSGWSMKHMQRLIVTSAAWKQTSIFTPNAQSQDPRTIDAAGRLLWRYPPRRMEAEAVHDVMLATAGTLDFRMGGRGYSVFAPNFNYVRVYDPKVEYGPSDWRRMVYQTKVRMAQDSTFGAFDCPDAGQSSPKRSRSTTPLQALNLFNSAFVNQQAALFAARLQKEAGNDVSKQVHRAFMLAFNRSPSSDELRTCEQLTYEHGLATLGRILFNTNEFLFLP